MGTMDKSGERSGLLARMREAAAAWYAEEAGRDEQALAKAVNAGRGSVWAWLTLDEASQSVPRADQIARFARVTGYNGHWLLTGIGPMDPPDVDAYLAGLKEGTAPVLRAADEAKALLRRARPAPDEMMERVNRKD